MKLKNALLCMISLFFLTISCSQYSGKISPKAVKGVLDLSDWDFEKDGPARLHGEWEFYWQQLLVPKDFNKENKPKISTMITVPSSWKGLAVDNKKIPGEGFATYRLNILARDFKNIQALHIPFQSLSYKVFINNKEVVRGGNPGKSREQTLHMIIAQSNTFEAKQESVQVLIQIANFLYPESGMNKIIQIGTEQAITKFRNIRVFFDIFSFASFFVMGLYFFALYFFRSNYPSIFFLGMFCLLIGTRILLTNETILQQIFNNIPASFNILAVFFTLFFSIPMFVKYFQLVFREEFNSKVANASFLFFILFIILCISFKTRNILIIIFYISLLFYLIYFIYVTIKAIVNKRDGAVIFLIASIINVLMTIQSVLENQQIINLGVMLGNFGFFMFLFAQYFILGKRFANDYKVIVLAKSELKVLNENLEEKVKIRTQELEFSTEELQGAMEENQAAMEQLESMNDVLVTSQIVAQRDMNMAIHVQKSLFPQLPPSVDGWDIAFAFEAMSGVSGDLYDFFVEDSKLLGLTISDVSGHGIASGLITMIARSVIFRNIYNNRNDDLHIIMDKINRDMIDEIGDVDNYLTSIILRIDKDNIEYVNAGHTDLLCKKAISGDVEIVNEDDDIRGVLLGLKGINLPSKMMSFQVFKNDVLLLFTDCLIESFNKDKEQYGEKRLMSALKNSPDGSSQEVLDYILNDFRSFIGSIELNDDLSVIILRKKEN